MKNEYEYIDDNTICIYVDSKKYGLQEIFIDAEDLKKVKKFTWHVDKSKTDNTLYAKASVPKKLRKKYKKSNIRMHRLVMNTPDGLMPNHINHNGLDNRKENLENVTAKRNCGDRLVYSNKKYKELPVGISYRESYHQFYVNYNDENGKYKSKGYSIKKYGYHGALAKAVKFRYKKSKQLGLRNKELIEFAKKNNIKLKNIIYKVKY